MKATQITKLLAMLFAFAFVFSACEEDDTLRRSNRGKAKGLMEDMDASYMTTSGTIVDIAIGNEDFETLVAAVIEAGLVDALADENANLTVFAPTDDAFEAIGVTPETVSEVDGLAEILLYHVLGVEVFSGDIAEGSSSATTLLEKDIYLSNVDKGIFINGKTEVVAADIDASNGVIHVIDNVLLPPTMDIVDIASGSDDFSTLVTAVAKAGLVDALKMDGPYTVFAPTNEAFADFLDEFDLTVEALLAVENRDLLTSLLLYHVVPARVFSTDLEDGLDAPTLLEDKEIEVKLRGKVHRVLLEDEADRTVPTKPNGLNILATNGVIHTINNVLFPFEVEDDDDEDEYDYDDEVDEDDED